MYVTAATEAIFNNMVCPQGWSLLLRVNLAPRGELLTPSFTPGVNTLLFRTMEGRFENFTPRGITSPLGGKIPAGQLRPWGSNFAPRSEVKNGPLVVISRQRLWRNYEFENAIPTFPVSLLCYKKKHFWKKMLKPSKQTLCMGKIMKESQKSEPVRSSECGCWLVYLKRVSFRARWPD
jgi:hypothetical protein